MEIGNAFPLRNYLETSMRNLKRSSRNISSYKEPKLSLVICSLENLKEELTCRMKQKVI